MAHNLDKQALSSRAYRDRLMNYLLDIGPNISRTVYLFDSPHLLASYPIFLDVIVLCSRYGTL